LHITGRSYTHTQEAYKAYERRRNAINDRVRDAEQSKQGQGSWSFMGKSDAQKAAEMKKKEEAQVWELPWLIDSTVLEVYVCKK
jgi:hypothetical protein